MDAKFTILTNSTKGVIEYKMVRKLFSIKIKYSILPLSQMKNLSDLTLLHGNIFLFPHKLSDPGTIWNEYDNKEKDATNYLKAANLNQELATHQMTYVVYADKKTNLLEKQPISLRSKPVRKKQRKSACNSIFRIQRR
jgi:hypothetical protein